MIEFIHEGTQYKITFKHLDKNQMIERKISFPRPDEPCSGMTTVKVYRWIGEEKQKWREVEEVCTYSNPSDDYSKFGGKIWGLRKLFQQSELFSQKVIYGKSPKSREIVKPANFTLRREIIAKLFAACPQQMAKFALDGFFAGRREKRRARPVTAGYLVMSALHK